MANVQLVLTFGSVEAARMALDKLVGAPVVVVQQPPPVIDVDVIEPPKQRKPRSDAGQARGTYKPRGAGAAAEETSSGIAGVSTASAETAATPPPPPPAKELTLDDAKAALQKVHDTAGLGIAKCQALLQQFGTVKITGVKKEDYAEFVAKCDEVVKLQAKAAA